MNKTKDITEKARPEPETVALKGRLVSLGIAQNLWAGLGVRAGPFAGLYAEVLKHVKKLIEGKVYVFKAPADQISKTDVLAITHGLYQLFRKKKLTIAVRFNKGSKMFYVVRQDLVKHLKGS